MMTQQDAETIGYFAADGRCQRVACARWFDMSLGNGIVPLGRQSYNYDEKRVRRSQSFACMIVSDGSTGSLTCYVDAADVQRNTQDARRSSSGRISR